ncbi:MAG: hypothetical protein ACI9MC_002085 [Kiritimatiellia bacterium]|jgi:hypothetical protein
MRLIPLFLVMIGCDYTAPLDPDALPEAGVLAGTIVVTGFSEPSTTMVLLYAADDPPPPLGLGRPVSFTTVPASDFDVIGEGEQHLLQADWTLAAAGVPDGEYLVTALVDVDNDFYPLPPFSAVTGGATCGDWSGAHVSDLSTFNLAPVMVQSNDLVNGITIVVGRQSTLERPAFVVAGGNPTVSTGAAEQGASQSIVLQSTAVHALLPVGDEMVPLLDLAGPFDGSDACGTAFWATAKDLDGDGEPDSHPDYPPELGLYDVWPRVYAEYLGEIGDDGAVIPTTESWSGQLVPHPNLVWFGELPVNQPRPLTELEVVWIPGARHTVDGVSTVVTTPSDLPKGAWALTVINIAGQTWTVPNALRYIGSSDPSSYDPTSQGAVLVVTE